jgi:hypothetical protein
MPKIIHLYHDGMVVEYEGVYYEVGLFDMFLDEEAWADHVYEYIVKRPDNIKKYGEVLSADEVEHRRKIALTKAYKKYFEILFDYYPELKRFTPIRGEEEEEEELGEEEELEKEEWEEF